MLQLANESLHTVNAVTKTYNYHCEHYAGDVRASCIPMHGATREEPTSRYAVSKTPLGLTFKFGVQFSLSACQAATKSLYTLP